MKNLNKVFSSLIFFSLLIGSSVSFGMTCQSLLKVETTRSDYRDRLTQDFKIIEVVASVALSLQLQPDRVALSLFRISDARNPKFPSVPRLNYDEASSYNMNNYSFGKIDDAEKQLIIDLLPELMHDLLSKASAGSNFNRRYDQDTVEGILDRRAEYLELFLADSIDAIILNAVKMPAMPARVKLLSFAKKNAVQLVFLSLPVGVLAENLVPGFGARMTDLILNEAPVFQEIFPNVVQNSFDWSSLRLYTTSVLGVHAPLTAATGSLNAIFNRNSSTDDRFHDLNHDFSYSQDVRNRLVDELVIEKFGE